MTEPAETAWEEEEEVGPLEVDLDCGNCGAKMTWDPASDALACKHCGHEREIPRGEGLIEEHPLSDAGAAARGLGLELKVGRCENCGARVSFDTASTSTSWLSRASAEELPAIRSLVVTIRGLASPLPVSVTAVGEAS